MNSFEEFPAACKAGKVEVTIINPAGKVKEISVAEAAKSTRKPMPFSSVSSVV